MGTKASREDDDEVENVTATSTLLRPGDDNDDSDGISLTEEDMARALGVYDDSDDEDEKRGDEATRRNPVLAFFRRTWERLRSRSSSSSNPAVRGEDDDDDYGELAEFELHSVGVSSPPDKAAPVPTLPGMQKAADDAARHGGEGVVLLRFDAAQPVADPAERYEARATLRRLATLRQRHAEHGFDTAFAATRRLLRAMARNDDGNTSLWRRIRTRLFLLAEDVGIKLRLASPELRAHTLTLAYCLRHRLTFGELAFRPETAPLDLRTLIASRVVRCTADLEQLCPTAPDLVATRPGQSADTNAAVVLAYYFGEPGLALGRSLLTAAEWRRNGQWRAHDLIVLGANLHAWPPLFEALRWPSPENARRPPSAAIAPPWTRGSEAEWMALGVDAAARERLGWPPLAASRLAVPEDRQAPRPTATAVAVASTAAVPLQAPVARSSRRPREERVRESTRTAPTMSTTPARKQRKRRQDAAPSLVH